MIERHLNTSILCVDDEVGILDAYRNTLGTQQDEGKDKLNSLLSKRRNRMSGNASVKASQRKSISYTIHTATSGEEAIEIVKAELNAGRQIGVGFFDMSMPGGIDGQETIQKILQLDNQMLCAVVTAYTDRTTEQLGKLFQDQDSWLYFNKPFSTGELEQTAYHLVTSWNRRRREESLISNLEMMQNGLISILDSVNNINRVPPLMLVNLMEGIINHFLALMKCSDGFIQLLDPGLDINYIGAGIFAGTEHFETIGMERAGELVQSAKENSSTVLYENMAATPLRIGDELFGILFVKADSTIHYDIKLLDMYANQVVNMLQASRLFEELEHRNLELNKKNQELVELLAKLTQSNKLKQQYEKLSYVDMLTGLPNRRYFTERFREEISRSWRYKFSMAFLLMDLDHFKVINDTYGHAAGDYVLKEIGGIIRTCKRSYDIVCRYGGEEFAMIFKQVDEQDTRTVCERIRSAVENCIIHYEGKEIKVTISIGIATLIPHKDDMVEDILKKADQALYEAKRRGRNTCVYL